MRDALRVLVVALTVLAFGGVSFSAEKSTDKSEKASDKSASEKSMDKTTTKPKTTRLTGEVTSVDTKVNTLTVKSKDNKEVNLTAESSSAKNALAKVKVGDMVRVSYTEKDGKMVANSISHTKGEDKKSDRGMEKSKATEKPEGKSSTK